MSVSWKRAFADHRLGHLAGDGDQRHGIHVGVGDAGDEVGRAGAAGGHADARPAGGAGVAFGGKRAALLVARQDRADFFERVSAWWISMLAPPG